MRLTALAFATMAVLPSTVLAQSYQGTWAAEAAWCDKTDDRSPMRITKTQLLAYEGKCTISNIENLNVALSWRWSLTCSAEGTDYTSDEIVLVTPGGKIFRYDTDGSVWQGVRCK